MTDSHQDIARTRYRQFFSSDLFGAVAVEDKSKNPSLNRRPADQTTAQLFGEYKETNIPPRKSELPEFVPRQPYASAHEKKLQEYRGSGFAASESATAAYAHAIAHRPEAAYGGHADTQNVFAERGAAGLLQYHLRSDGVIPGDNTPAAAASRETAIAGRLMAANETWYSVAEGNNKDKDSTVAARVDRERNSSVMDLPQKSVHRGNPAEAQAADSIAEHKRRNNMMYSDLFGRPTPDCVGQEPSHKLYRAKPQSCEAASMMESTDSIIGSNDADKDTRSSLGQEKSNGVARNRLSGEGLFMEDNSSKVAWDETHGDPSDARNVRQHHLRSSIHIGDLLSGSPQGSPPRSPEVNDWNITELAVSGLKENMDELAFRRDVMPGDCHIVKASLNVDLVGGRCLGGARVLVRHNPKSEDLRHVLEELNAKGYGVKLLSTAKPN